jgi:hypothetical protein
MLTGKMRPRLTTRADHNKTGREPIGSDAQDAQSQVRDGFRQPGRILQARGQGFESP